MPVSTKPWWLLHLHTDEFTKSQANRVSNLLRLTSHQTWNIPYNNMQKLSINNTSSKTNKSQRELDETFAMIDTCVTYWHDWSLNKDHTWNSMIDACVTYWHDWSLNKDHTWNSMTLAPWHACVTHQQHL